MGGHRHVKCSPVVVSAFTSAAPRFVRGLLESISSSRTSVDVEPLFRQTTSDR